MAKRDYYDVLGINKNATLDEIKKAYRKKANETHPDKGGNEDDFKIVAEANEVLSNEETRKKYDAFGHDFNKRNQPQSHRWSTREHIIVGDNVSINLELTLEEIYSGLKKTINYKRNESCKPCGGNGGTTKSTCQTCNGSGSVSEIIQTPFGRMLIDTDCRVCGGLGETYTNVCGTCNGTGVNSVIKSIDIDIPHGVMNGMQMIAKQEGNSIKHGTINGDLIIRFNEKKHDKFIRDNNDLKLNIKLGYTQLVIGDKIEINTISNKIIRVNIESGSQVGSMLRVKSMGMKVIYSEEVGDLIITLDVNIPTKISDEEMNLINNLKNFERKIVY